MVMIEVVVRKAPTSRIGTARFRRPEPWPRHQRRPGNRKPQGVLLQFGTSLVLQTGLSATRALA